MFLILKAKQSARESSLKTSTTWTSSTTWTTSTTWTAGRISTTTSTSTIGIPAATLKAQVEKPPQIILPRTQQKTTQGPKTRPTSVQLSSSQNHEIKPATTASLKAEWISTEKVFSDEECQNIGSGSSLSLIACQVFSHHIEYFDWGFCVTFSFLPGLVFGTEKLHGCQLEG